jgi:hypothetical protein
VVGVRRLPCIQGGEVGSEVGPQRRDGGWERSDQKVHPAHRRRCRRRLRLHASFSSLGRHHGASPIPCGLLVKT